MSKWLKRAARGAREAVENSEAEQAATALAAQRFRWWAAPWSGLAWNWADAAKARTSEFKPSRAAERSYERVLRGLATKIGSVLKNNHPRDAENILREYAEIIDPWARQSAENMLMGVSRDNAAKFKRLANRMGYDMRIFLAQDGVGRAVAERIEANTALIKSLPLDAAIRAGELAHESLITGMRAEDIAAQLHKIGGTTMSRVRTIALTEVSKASTALTKARAESVDSEGYIWRSVRDGATRPSHRAMEGKFVKWSEPPMLDGMTGHAGEFPNCRCYPEPVIPKSDGKGVYGSPLPTLEQERESGKKPLTEWEKTQLPEITDVLEQKIGVLKGAPIPMEEAASSANPLWKIAVEYQTNCQRCVPTFELRRRGYDVNAMPRPYENGAVKNGTTKRPRLHGWDGFKDPEVHGYLKVDGSWNIGATIIRKQALISDLKQLPDGARVGICYKHSAKLDGHTMVCEKKDGKLIFMDPQTGTIGNHALGNAWNKLGYLWFRMDNLELDESFEWDEVVKGVTKK